jgi:hypothetical protein
MSLPESRSGDQRRYRCRGRMDSRMLAFGGNVRLKDEERLETPWLRTVGC